MDFTPFPKIPRASRALHCKITEKIDGTNAQIVIKDGAIVKVGSRKRWITPGKDTDNFGFAGWVEANADELLKLGDGTHFGEWYGSGIQRGYGLTEKRFALFNVWRWADHYAAFLAGESETFPSCVEVVPTLYSGLFTDRCMDEQMDRLFHLGSFAVDDFWEPEGIVVHLNGSLIKHTFEHAEGKWKDAA